MKTSSQILRDIRIEMRMTVKELSEVLGVSDVYIYTLEASKRTPSKSIIDRITSLYLEKGGKREVVNGLFEALVREYKERNIQKVHQKAERIFCSSVKN